MRIPILLAAVWLTAIHPQIAIAQVGAAGDEPAAPEAGAIRLPRDAGVLPAAYRWQDAAREVLTENQIRQLAADKLLIAAKSTFSQAGEAYYWSPIPPFVTSDSLLAGYHRVYEDSVMLLEEKRASQLRPVLQTLWAALPDQLSFFGEPEAVTDAGRDRARFVVGVAMRLLGDEPLDPAVEGDLAKQIDAQVARIVRAGDAGPDAPGVAPPTWLPEIDYDRLNPRSFYTRSEPLRRYFRAVAWLQEVPFFIEADASLAAVILLVRSVPDRWEEEPEPSQPGRPPAASGEAFWAFHTEFEQLVGGRDDWDLRTFNGAAIADGPNDPLRGLLDADGLAEARAFLQKRWQDGWPYRAALVGLERRPHFRIFSALRTPDAVLFTETTRDVIPPRIPNGLEVPAALGSAEALALLRASEGDAVADAARDRLVQGDAEHAGEDEVEADAERGAGRTLYADYLFCLQALLDAPEPDAPAIFASTPWKRKSLQTTCAGWAQLRHTWALQAKESGGLFGGTRPVAGFVEPEPEFFARLAHLAERSERLFRGPGEVGDPPAAAAAADAEGGANGPTLRDRWQLLARLARRLEVLAHKQLRGAAFSRADERFLRGYGERLSEVMGYSSASPVPDDAPWVASVFHQEGGGDLQVATGRPTAMYLLYPYKGRDVLCMGVVVPYHEFVHGGRLTDEAWRTLLDSPERPPVPEWVRGLYNDDELPDEDAAGGGDRGD